MDKTSAPKPGLLELPLASFVRRCQQTNQLKALIKASGGKLTRKGRSRHWLLSLPHQQKSELISRLYQSEEPSWLWLAKALAESKRSYSFEELLNLAKQEPSITLNELMSLTDCTISQARRVLDELEWKA